MISSGFLVCLISIYFMMVGNGTTLYASAIERKNERSFFIIISSYISFDWKV